MTPSNQPHSGGGISPIHTEKASAGACWTGLPQGYPRTHEDDSQRDYCATVHLGISPRVRGRLDLRIRPKALIGYIPTRVGTTYMGYYGVTLEEVYPHACGDDETGRCVILRHYGISPRVRGRRDNIPCGNG